MFSSPSLFPHLLKAHPTLTASASCTQCISNYLKTSALLGKGGVFVLTIHIWNLQRLASAFGLGLLVQRNLSPVSAETAVNLRGLIQSPKSTQTFS